MKAKKFIVGTICIVAFLLAAMGIFVAVIDPYFHYHKPLSNLEYPMDNEYYQNAGIARNFDFEAVIAGDSMTQNFKASQAEALWGLKTVKIPNPGAPLRETDKAVKFAIKHQDNLKLVIRQLDDYMYVRDAYAERYASSDNYLYNDNPFDDVKYLWEKETFIDAFTVLTYTRAGKTTPDFDVYSNETEYEEYGNMESLAGYLARTQAFYFDGDLEEVKDKALENIRVNVIQTALDNPDIEFYFFVPPYSGAYWKEIQNAGVMDNELAVEKAVLSEVLAVDNIMVFYFMDDFDITTDWSHYSDELHFDEGINEYILDTMAAGDRLLTRDNLDEHLQNLEDFYSSYDFNEMLED